MNLVSMPISQLATVQSGGGAPQDSAAFTRTGSPFVRAGSLPKLLDGAEEDSLELIEPEVADEYRLKLFPEGTVLFAKSGMSATKGHVYRLRKPAYVVNHLAALVPHEPGDSAFLAHALQRYSPTTLIKDPTYPSIRLGDIESMRIQAPTSPRDRERIAEILDEADALRAKRRAARAQLDTLIQSIFLAMFGDPATNPKAWPVVPLAELGENQDSLRVPVKESDRDERKGGFPYYGASGIIDWVDDFIFEGERLLIGEDGANLVARATPVAFIARGKYWVNNHAHVIAENGHADLRFLEFFVERIDLKPFLSGTAQPKLNRGNLDRIPVPTPPLPLQRQFASRVVAVEALKAQQHRALVVTDSLFATLQHDAFCGGSPFETSRASAVRRQEPLWKRS